MVQECVKLWLPSLDMGPTTGTADSSEGKMDVNWRVVSEQGSGALGGQAGIHKDGSELTGL